MKLRILHIVEGVSNKATGQIAVVKELIRYQSLNHNVDMFTIDENNNIPEISGLNKLYLFEPDYKKWKYSRRAKKELEKIISSYDLVHVHGLWLFPHYIGCRLSYKYKVPYMISLHGMISEWFFKNYFFAKKYQLYLKIIGNTLLNNASLIHTLSERETNNFLKICNYNGKIVEIPNGIKINKDQQINSITKNDDKYLLFLGRIHPIKGLDLLINAWKRIYHQYFKINLVIIGDFNNENYKKEIFHLVDNNPEKYRIKFCGSIFGEKKWEYLQGSLGVVLPSISEACSVTLLEAASLPKPIIVTENAVLSGMENEKSVILVKSNIDSLTNGLKKLLEMNISERKSLTDALFSLISNNYDIQKTTDMITKTYYNILKI